MIWLELRNNDQLYNDGWNFSESVWAPIKKKKGGNWPFWNLINQVAKGDIIFHLRNINRVKRFVGYSTAMTDGYLTQAEPTQKEHEWDFSQGYYKVDLTDFKELNPAISLSEFFRNNNENLRTFFEENKVRKNNKQRLFYVVQSNRLQCLNGAYFSEFKGVFPSMLSYYYIDGNSGPRLRENVSTSTAMKELSQRIGHQDFSDNVKRNFDYKCGFPGCQVEEKGFLVSGHIDRWADNEVLRGHTGNGLCLCLMHDKAFEKGYFTLDENYRVVIINAYLPDRRWLNEFLKPGEGLEIKPRKINPLDSALSSHWKRIGYIAARS